MHLASLHNLVTPCQIIFGVWHCICSTTGIRVYTETFVAQEENEFQVMSCVCVHECIQVHAFERACVCANLHV